MATLSRHLAAFAKANGYPLLVVRGGESAGLTRDGSVETLVLKRGAAAFPLDKSLYFDPLLSRHKQLVIDQIHAFKPDLLHITGPGDLGFMGALVAHVLHLPWVASWHTNLHEYLSRRLLRALEILPRKLREDAASAAERHSLRGLLRFYRMARFVLAPNQTAVDLLHARTKRPAFLMLHGADLDGFHPARNVESADRPFCIGYVGRLTTEKNVRSFVDLEQKLLAAGESNFRFLLVGEGGQERWLRKNLRKAELPGVLRGEQLAAAYRRMDAFVFPSLTDTYGLVILEAMASGVPVILAPETGRRVGVENGVSGFLSEDFAHSLQQLLHNPDKLESMRKAARQFAVNNSWQRVFQQLYQTYSEGLAIDNQRRSNQEALTKVKV